MKKTRKKKFTFSPAIKKKMARILREQATFNIALKMQEEGNIKRYSHSPLADFDGAMQAVNNQRGTVYGHPAVNFDRIARIRSVVADCADPRARVTLDEIAMKMSRLVESPYHLDSWIDVAGYARAYVMILQREQGYPDYPQDEGSGD